MKRIAMMASVGVLVSTCLWAGTAGSQIDETPTTTIAEEVTTTTAAEQPTTTIAEPATSVPDTTIVDAPTTTVAEVPPIVVETPEDLPGQHVAAGSLAFDVQFADTPSSNCSKTLDLAGGQTNIALDDSGNLGGLYGFTNSGTGKAGVFMVGLGAVPVGVAVLSVSDDTCEFDAVGIGSYTATGGSAELKGTGIGIHPGQYTAGEFIELFNVSASVQSVEALPKLDLTELRAFVLRPRAGLDLPVDTVPPTTVAAVPPTTVAAG